MKSILGGLGLSYTQLSNDKYLIDNSLQINVNDYYGHSDAFVAPKTQYHEMLKNLDNNITTLNFYIGEIENNRELVSSMIASRVGKSQQKIYARHCEIIELPAKVARQFCEQNHLSAHANAKYYIGLGYKDKLVAVMSFGIPRFSKKYDYELIRFCSLANSNVIGGASKLFKYFVKTYMAPGQSITTYANRRFSEGNMYRKLGFKDVSTSYPNYFYIKENSTPKMRYDCQKHKLYKFLEVFDANKTEYENMTANGYYRQYDCGNYVFEYRL